MGTRAGVSGLLTAREARDSGAESARLVGAGYRRPTRGVYLPQTWDPTLPDVRIAVVGARLPAGFALGGWAAARLHERGAKVAESVTVFDGRLPEMDVAARRTEPVLICSSRERRLRTIPGARLYRSDLAPGDVMELEGVPVTSPLRTAFDLARLWPRTSAVVALDRLRALGLVAARDLADLIDERAGWRGTAQARRALAFSDDGAESPRETMVRLVWLAARLPRPLCNPVVTARNGDFLGRVDLLDDGAGLVAEYDGADHAGAARRHDDAVRQERLEQAGLVVLRVNDPDIASPAGRRLLQHRLAQGRARALAWSRPRAWRTLPQRP